MLSTHETTRLSLPNRCRRTRRNPASFSGWAKETLGNPNPHSSVPELNWPPAPWTATLSRSPPGKWWEAGIDTRRTLRAPGNNSRTLWMVNPNIAALGPVTIKAGFPLRCGIGLWCMMDQPIPVVDKLAAEFRNAK